MSPKGYIQEIIVASLIDILSRRRYQVVTLLALSYLFFQTMSLSFIPDVTGLPHNLVNRLEDFGVIIYLLCVIIGSVYFYIARRHGDKVTSALKDDLVEDHMQRAVKFGFKAVFLTTMILFSCLQFIEIDAEDVARIILTLCLSAPFLRFAYLEAKHA